MEERRPPAPLPGVTIVEQESFGTLANKELRKREQPFIERLTPTRLREIERISYYAAYKGVTDLLTKYLWPEWALALTRLAVRLGLSPERRDRDRRVALRRRWRLLSGAAGIGAGIAAGFVFMVLDTVDGKLARCTITSSRLGDALRSWHRSGPSRCSGGGPGAEGFDDYGRRAAVRNLRRRDGGDRRRLYRPASDRRRVHRQVRHPHSRLAPRLDSRFRLVTARRNPNIVILVVALAARLAGHRPARRGGLDNPVLPVPPRPADSGLACAGARPPHRKLAAMT